MDGVTGEYIAAPLAAIIYRAHGTTDRDDSSLQH